MSVPSRRAFLRLSFASLIAGSGAPRAAVARPAPADAGVRGLWVTRSWMTSPAQVAQVVADARRHGFTAVFVQVRGRGDAFYVGGPDPRSTLLARQAQDFDPLATLIAHARDAGIHVHAWLNVNLVAGATALPSAPQHVVVAHPEWLMVPRPLAVELARLAPRDRRYLARIATWSRSHAATVEGVFSSPIPEAAQDRAVAVVDHLTTRYALDGLHLDYIRYPTPDYDYSRGALDAFRDAIVPELTPRELASLDARTARNPLAYVDDYASRWETFRRERLTRLVTRLRDRARVNRADIRMSAAVWPDPTVARQRKLQDWAAWLQDGLVDAVCPMMYVADGDTFERQLQALADQPRAGVWPGIGAYKIAADEAARRVDAARALGFGGVMLYSYDSMTGGPGRPSPYLATLQRRAFSEGIAGPAGAAR